MKKVLEEIKKILDNNFYIELEHCYPEHLSDSLIREMKEEVYEKIRWVSDEEIQFWLENSTDPFDISLILSNLATSKLDMRGYETITAVVKVKS